MPFCGYSLPELFWKHLFSTTTLKNDCNLNRTLMPVTSIMQLLHAFFSARGNIVRIDSCTDDSIRISLTVAIRLIGAPVNRYTPSHNQLQNALFLPTTQQQDGVNSIHTNIHLKRQNCKTTHFTSTGKFWQLSGRVMWVCVRCKQGL